MKEDIPQWTVSQESSTSRWEVWEQVNAYRVCRLKNGEKAERYARLIAAAPDLLRAARLFSIYDRASEAGCDVQAMLAYADMAQAMHAALTKAEGE